MDAVYYKKETESCVLFVGEGDFSFAANYTIKMRDCNEKVYASCLSKDPLTERQKENINIIEKNGGIVFTDVDATMLDSHPKLIKTKFSKIVFNFPHIPGKMNIRKNRQLVENFFISAAKILVNSGMILVTLCKGQGGTEVDTLKRKWCDTWQIVSLAASAALILFEIKAFDAKAFQMYRCTGFRGLQKPFNTEGALTHIFMYGSPINWIYKDITKNFLNIDLYLHSLEALHKKFYGNFCQPSFKVLSIVKDISRKIFSSISEQNTNNLFTCKMNSAKSDSDNLLGEELCKDCAKYLFFQSLQDVKGSSIVFATCNISCMKMIDIKKNPFHHLVSYFSTDGEYLLKCLPMLLEKLNDLFDIKRSETKFNFPNCVIRSKTFMKTGLYKTDTVASDEFGVKTTLNLYARYSINQEMELFFYSGVDLFSLESSSNESKPGNILKIGTVLQYDYKFKSYKCILFYLNSLAYLKYHIMDFRTVISCNSFYCSKLLWECPTEIYRPISLYPPTYVHDTSFYIESDFCENSFFLVVRNLVGYLVKSVTLIDSYYDKSVEKYSRCYRFIYQSCDQILTKDIASKIHSSFVRHCLRNSLNIQLR